MSGRTVVMNCQSPVAHRCGLLNHPNRFCRRIFNLNTKFHADLSLYQVSHFECDSHTVHMLTQWHLLPPLTSIVKSSLFTHMHSSPLSLAARLHGCHSHCSCYINNGWTFSRQTSIMPSCAQFQLAFILSTSFLLEKSQGVLNLMTQKQ